MKRIKCPQCQVLIDPSGIRGDSATCQSCNRTYRLKTKSSASRPATSHPDVPQPPEPPEPEAGLAPPVSAPPPATPASEPAEPTTHGPPTAPLDGQPSAAFSNLNTPALVEVRTKSAFDKVLPLVIVISILAVVGLIIGFVVIRAGGKSDPPAEMTVADRDSQPRPSQSPKSESREGGAVLDLSDLTTLDTMKSSPSGRPAVRSNQPPAGSGLQWPEHLQLISIGAIASIDGVPQTQLAEAGFADAGFTLPSPPGTHAISDARTNSPRMTQSSGFPKYYSNQLEKYRGSEGLDYAKLAQAAVAVDGIYREPILPHCFGNYYWQTGEPDAAVRFWNLAVLVSPSFAPAHLNLAYAAHQRRDSKVATHELSLASALNVQDAFGIGNHLVQLERDLAPEQRRGVYSRQDYLPDKQLTGKTRDVVNVFLAVRDIAPAAADQAACLNNIGVYLMHEVNLPGDAVGFLQQAHLALADASPPKSASISKTILSNLVQAAESAGFAEADLFRQLASSR